MNTRKMYMQLAQRMVGMALITGLCLFLPAGTLCWWNGWAFMAISLVLISILTGMVFFKTPDLVQERMTAGDNAKGWDKVLVPILALVLPMASNVVAGLDHRFGWSEAPRMASLLALPVMIAGIALTWWAMDSNPFFSSHVRIQEERGHKVVSKGPYAAVRHPGYAGAALYNVAAPVLLGSWAALGVGVLMLGVFVLRTHLEDLTLQRELPGYREYAAKVRSRLIPFLY